MVRKKKNILFLDQFGDKVGGGQSILLGILDYFRSTENWNIYIGLPEEGKFTKLLKEKGFSYWVIPTGTHSLKKHFIYDLSSYAYSSLKAAWTLSRLVKKHQIDVIYCNGGRTFLTSSILSLISPAKIIWHIHLIFEGRQKRMVTLFGRLPQIKSIIAVSDTVLHQYKRTTVFSKMQVIHNWVNSPFLEKRQVKRSDVFNLPIKISVIGQISNEKGQWKILDELKKQSSPLPIEITFIGEPLLEQDSHWTKLQNTAKELNQQGWKIRIKGYCNDIPNILDHNDVLLISSLVPESFGLTAIEAMARETVVVANHCGALPEVIDNKNGILFDIEQKGELLQIFDRLSKNQYNLNQFRKNGLNAVKTKYSPDKQIKKVHSLVSSQLKKIYFDCRMYPNSGIGTYIQNLVTNIETDHSELPIELLVRDNKKTFPSTQLAQQTYNDSIYGIKEQVRWIEKIKTNSVLHVPHYNAPVSYKGTLIVTVHDICHAVMKEFFPGINKRLYAEQFLKLVIKRADAIITVSEFSKKEIIHFFQVPEEKIQVIHNGVSDFFYRRSKEEIQQVQKKYNLPSEYLLFLGNVKPHKNINGLIISYSQALQIDPSLPPLVITGKKYELIINNPEFKNICLSLITKKQIIFTGYLPYEDLPAIYSGAMLFLFPSLYEGFGLPPLEAMACGTPVITSNCSSLPEVTGDAAIYIDPMNNEELANSIIKLAQDIDLQLSLIEKGFEQIKKFSWKNSAQTHVELYKQFW